MIDPLRTNLAQVAVRSTRFRAKYTIMGSDKKLEIKHAVNFVLTDCNRWSAQNSPEPKSFVRTQVIKATKVFLHDKRFEDVVNLCVGQEGESQLSNAVASLVAPNVATIGYRLVSNAAILAIAEID